MRPFDDLVALYIDGIWGQKSHSGAVRILEVNLGRISRRQCGI